MHREEGQEFNNEVAREERRTTRSQQRIDAQRGRISSRGRGAGVRSKSVGFSHAEFRDSPHSFTTSLNESGTSTISRTLTPNIHANPSIRKSHTTLLSDPPSRFEIQTEINETSNKVDNVSQSHFLNSSEPNIAINLSSDSSNNSANLSNQDILNETITPLITTSTRSAESNSVQSQSPNQTVNTSQPNQIFSPNPTTSDNLSQTSHTSQNEQVNQTTSTQSNQSQTANSSENQTTPTTTNTPNLSPNLTSQASNNIFPVTPTNPTPGQPSVTSPQTPTNANRNILLSPTTRLLLQRAAQQAPSANIRNTPITPVASPVSSRTFFSDNERIYNTPIPRLNRLLNLNPHSCFATPQFATPIANQFQPIGRLITNPPM